MSTTTPSCSAPSSPRRRRQPAPERLRRAVSGGDTRAATRLVHATAVRNARQTQDALSLYAQLHSLQRALDDASTAVYEEHVRHALLVQEAALRAASGPAFSTPRSRQRHSLPPRPAALKLACAASGAEADDNNDDAGTATTDTDSSTLGEPDECSLCAARPVQAATSCCAHEACRPCFSHVTRCPWCRAAPLRLYPRPESDPMLVD